MGPANVYTYLDILKPHPIVRIGICTTLLTFYRMRKFVNFPEFHSGLIWIQTVLANVKRERERERGRLVHAHLFMKIKVHRQIEMCVCVCVCVCACVCVRACVRVCVFFLNFVIFFLTLRFQSFVCRSLQKNPDRTRCH